MQVLDPGIAHQVNGQNVGQRPGGVLLRDFNKGDVGRSWVVMLLLTEASVPHPGQQNVFHLTIALETSNGRPAPGKLFLAAREVMSLVAAARCAPRQPSRLSGSAC